MARRVTTGYLVPFEAYAMVQRATMVRAAILTINVAIVASLLARPGLQDVATSGTPTAPAVMLDVRANPGGPSMRQISEDWWIGLDETYPDAGR